MHSFSLQRQMKNEHNEKMKKKHRKLNQLGDVIVERLCWPSEWARLLSLDFSTCPLSISTFFSFIFIKQSLSAMTFGGMSTEADTAEASVADISRVAMVDVSQSIQLTALAK